MLCGVSKYPTSVAVYPEVAKAHCVPRLSRQQCPAKVPLIPLESPPRLPAGHRGTAPGTKGPVGHRHCLLSGTAPSSWGAFKMLQLAKARN